MRLGVLGGTFDPIHLGHVAIAAAVRDRFRLDRMLLLPAWLPPHKRGEPVTPFPHRFAMAGLAAEGLQRVEASDEEGRRPGPSFTVHTLARLRGTLGADDPLLFVMGSDSLLDLPTWREPETILSLASLVVAPRTGSPIAAAASRLPGGLATRLTPIGGASAPEPLPAAGHIYLTDLPAIEVSGTEVRRRAREGRPLAGLVPVAVAAYIAQHGLYAERRDPSTR